MIPVSGSSISIETAEALLTIHSPVSSHVYDLACQFYFCGTAAGLRWAAASQSIFSANYKFVLG